MSSEPISRESRRSTRVPLKVVIEVHDNAESLTGETIVVNLHGALIATSTELNAGMRISIYVYLTDKRARAQVVHIDPQNPMCCGIELDKPQNIWGVPLPPDDWEEAP
jgi:PilZ domain